MSLQISLVSKTKFNFIKCHAKYVPIHYKATLLLIKTWLLLFPSAQITTQRKLNSTFKKIFAAVLLEKSAECTEDGVFSDNTKWCRVMALDKIVNNCAQLNQFVGFSFCYIDLRMFQVNFLDFYNHKSFKIYFLLEWGQFERENLLSHQHNNNNKCFRWKIVVPNCCYGR